MNWSPVHIPARVWFSESEVQGLDSHLVQMLITARARAGTPFVITEGLASGGSHVADTAHGRGLAVDIRCSGSAQRMQIVAGLLAAGFRRVGIYDRHVHADVDPTLPQDVMWWGKSS